MVSTALYISPPEQLRDRLVARIRTRSLDAALANGTPPETDAALAVRARRLTNLPARRKLALAIRHVVRDAGGAGARSHVRVSPVSDRVSEASRELRMLAEKLAEPAPTRARGVAQAHLLLTDGTGPLYNPRSEGSVRDRAASAVSNLSLGS
ncbi:MAG TPA: hypothetical protein VMP89_20420 [Solirubrobacteraceae bacterium]|nr:hypothetical protein [Solirubrobacteraceae bacterium]